jgi:hypothetical protein
MANISQINGLLINAATASFATTASFLLGSVTSASFASTASTAPNASLCIFGNMAGTGFTNPIVTYLPFGTTSVSAAENQRKVASPMAGSLKNLFIRTNNTAPATSVTTFTLRINGVNTNIRVIISGSQVADKYFNITNSASVAVGDEITLQVSTSIANGPQVNQYSFGIFNT